MENGIVLEETSFATLDPVCSTVVVRGKGSDSTALYGGTQESKNVLRESADTSASPGLESLRVALHAAPKQACTELREALALSSSLGHSGNMSSIEAFLRHLSAVNIRLADRDLSDLRRCACLRDVEETLAQVAKSHSQTTRVDRSWTERARLGRPWASKDAENLAKVPFESADETGAFWVRPQSKARRRSSTAPQTPRVLRRKSSMTPTTISGRPQTEQSCSRKRLPRFIGGVPRRSTICGPEAVQELELLYLRLDHERPPQRKQLKALEARAQTRPGTPEFLIQAKTSAKTYSGRARGSITRPGTPSWSHHIPSRQTTRGTDIEIGSEAPTLEATSLIDASRDLHRQLRLETKAHSLAASASESAIRSQSLVMASGNRCRMKSMSGSAYAQVPDEIR